MLVKAIKTRPLLPPKDDLLSVIKQSFLKFKLKEKSIIVITSKVVSIWEGRCIKIDEKIDKDDLIKKEADFYLEKHSEKYDVMLTIKDNILIPTAGIDESNAKGYYVLWPKNPFLSAKKIYDFVKKEFKLKQFGIIISDSHTTPLTAGIMGIGIAFFGFYPLRDYRGKKDIFGRKLKMSQTNLVDSLAASAVYEMGEGSEQTPIAVIEGVGDIKFGKFDFSKNNPIEIKTEDDIYYPLLKNIKWKKGLPH
ncbi:MAG: coenzyme F420-0:L-glutamate ligase [Candidatus Staskawiczbacteria bacterium]|nr:coenzyme F420-0:L-glutamate ligase [Candidatus Staskawiczbacteria bacterium]